MLALPARISSFVVLCSALLAGCRGRGPLTGTSPDVEAAFSSDSECAALGGGVGAACALSMLQVRGARAGHAAPPTPEDDVLIVNDLPKGWNDSAIDEEGPSFPEKLEQQTTSGNCMLTPFAHECFLLTACQGRKYCIMGGYMVVPGWPVTGMEEINGGNAGQYDFLMSVSRDQCGSPNCVLITNPVGHRTQEQLHIHYRHYDAGGAAMKSRLESALCGTSGWQPFHQCSSGKAKLYSEFPAVFSEVSAAYGGGSLARVGITVWFTTACGGGGVKTMVLATTDCSIEHSISAR